MTQYVLRRVALFVLGLVLTSALVFALLRVLPGDAAQVMGGVKATPERLDQIRAAYGLDRSLPAQYGSWLAGLLHGDLGQSLITGVPIKDEITQKFALTLPLAGLSLLFSLLIGVPLGIASAVYYDTKLGGFASAVAQGLAAIPIVWAGLLLIILLGKGAGLLELLPSQGFPRTGWSEPGRAFASLILPALAVGIVEGAVILRFVRSALLEARGQDHVRTAAALGLTRRQALIRRGLPGAGPAILSVVALQAASLIVGVVVVEALFALPGMGSMLVTDVGNRDLIKVQSTVLVLVGLVLLIGLLVDIASRLIDPRQRRAGE
ncbi:MAG: ABC transporter permease [Bifidobacteriaceae bacterium]|jgi:peptide/nickel transport system permease protein|nr:ABC transporter permease [Bifidobacteriaceae bacterium]